MASYRKRNGKWQFRITYKDDQGQRKEIPRGGFRTKAEAQNAAPVSYTHLTLPTNSLV